MANYRKRKECGNELLWHLAIIVCLQPTEVSGAGCSSSDLQKGISILGSCDFQIHEECRAVCVLKSTVIWKLKVRCLADRKWSPLPQCKYPFRYSLRLVACSNLTHDAKNTACLELYGHSILPRAAEKVLCPELFHVVATMHNCSRELGTDCTITCRNVTSVLRCLPNGNWSHIPDCPLSDEAVCPPLKFADLINCTRKPGESCKVRCRNGKISPEVAVCLPSLEWSPLPSCNYREQCARESLPRHIKFVQPSCKMSTEMKCKVGCYVRIFSPGAKFKVRKLVYIQEVVCESRGEWKGFPDCKKAKKVFWDMKIQTSRCPVPKVESPVILQANCSTIDGSVCKIRCEKGFVSRGTKSIHCSNKTWSGFPKCEENNYCEPKISSNILFVEKCSFKSNEKCQVRCRNTLALIGINFVFCRNKKWEDIPQCIPYNMSSYAALNLKCEDFPSISSNLKLVGICTPQAGLSCDVKCRDLEASMTGPNATTCLPTGKWSDVNSCSGGQKYCSIFKSQEHEVIEDCTGKVPGDTCLVRCKRIQQRTFTATCLKNFTWNLPPPCVCPVPQLTEGLEFNENCSYKIFNKSCQFICKAGFSLLGPEFATCTETLEWSPLPYCEKTFCPKPHLPEYLIFYEDCSSKTDKEHCRLECREGGSFIEQGIITCINGSQWSDMPACTCSVPTLSNDLSKREKCDRKRVGEKCVVDCKGASEIFGDNFIICDNNTKWTKPPTCIKRICPPPQFQEIITYLEDCRMKSAGEYCKIECKEGGNLIDSSEVICINGTHWSDTPRCTCPHPSLSDNLIFIKECSNMIPGQHCRLTCKTSFRLIGNHDILCQNNTRWTSLPKCEKKICPKPQLPAIHIYNEDCTRKMVGEKCRLSCREGGMLLDGNSIICYSDMKWSAVPNCSCPSPNLPSELEVKENCQSKRIGENCSLSCKNKAEILSNGFITCQNSTKWSSLPTCKRNVCPRPKLPISLIFSEDCTSKMKGEKCQVECREGNELIGKNFIMCINAEKWTTPPNCTCPFPVLSEDLELTTNCNKKQIGAKCNLVCKGSMYLVGKNVISCGNNLKWTALPKCRKSECRKPKLTEALEFKDDCTSLTAGEHCLLECKEGGEIIGNNHITCINGTRWTALPKCACPAPDLTDELQVKENCKSKHVSQVCHVECKQNLSLVGLGYITCLNNSKWSKLPRCKTITCSKPLLPATLSFDEDCSSKKLGQSCRLKCKEGGKFLTSNDIVCTNETTWTGIPVCTCPPPDLPEYVQTKENCSYKTIGQKCHLMCPYNMYIVGQDFVKCEESTRWTNFPICIKTICQSPTLPEILIYKEDCTAKVIGDTCTLKCRYGGQPLQTEKITCLNGTNWSAFPICSCARPVLSNNVETVENCSLKVPRQRCLVKCKNGFRSKNNYLTCLNNMKWSEEPKCGKNICIPPKLPPFLTSEGNCSTKVVGEKCKLSCKQGGNVIGKPYTECLNTTQWTSFPKCFCPSPILKEQLHLAEDCTEKQSGDNCLLACKYNLTIVGKNYILCKNDTTWTTQPFCKQEICSLPQLPKYLSFNEDCASKPVGGSCHLSCTEGGNVIGSAKIKCKTTSEWTSLPNCTCPQPMLQDNLESVENCSHVIIGHKCQLMCKEKMHFEGQNFITCLNSTQWSKPPKCVPKICRQPNLTKSLSFDGECISKEVGNFCRLKCNQGGKPIGNTKIICLDREIWTALPTCSCPPPILRDYLMQEHDCASKKSNEICEIRCKFGGKLIGTSHIKCLDGIKWSRLPECNCPAPMLSGNVVARENCSSKHRGENCSLSCDKGFEIVGINFITCQKEAKWSPLPKCKIMYCPKPIINDDIYSLAENCTTKSAGEICNLTCAQGGKIIGGQKFKCLNDTKWSDRPECSCPLPILRNELHFEENCDSKNVGDKCILKCKLGMKIKGKHYITCQNNTKWDAQPLCEMNMCPKPILPEGVLQTEENCGQKIANETCKLKCTEGGHILGEKMILCINGTHWSQTPDCTCPAPILEKDIDAMENCNSKKRGDTCKLRCKSKQKLLGIDFIKCKKDTKWSPQPKCKAITCHKPNFADDILKTAENCSSKTIGDTCKLMCTQGGNILGTKEITCVNETLWSRKPDCACPSPQLQQGLESKENCTSKKGGETCKLRCEGKQKIIGEDFIKCEKNTKWSLQPTCKLIICPKPIFPESTLQTAENCSSKAIGESCLLMCKEGGKILGSNSITCINETHWSIKPHCACPAPTLDYGLDTEDDCNSKKTGEICKLRCKGKLKLEGANYIECENNTKWSPQPKCKNISCQTPEFPDSTLRTAENCSTKMIGDTCRLMCTEGGKMLGPDNITCVNTTHWTTKPECACPSPKLEEGLETKEDCSTKKKGETCRLHCKGKQKLLGADFIKCERNAKWSFQPKCKFIICPKPNFPGGVMRATENCSSKTIGDACKLTCVEGGKMLGPKTITCINETHWSKMPDCACPAPTLEQGLETKETCNSKKRGETCKLRCKGKQKLFGMDFIKCEINAKWSSQPKCKLILCTKPNLSEEILRTAENCSSKVIGDTCKLTCIGGGKILGPNNITCINETHWSSKPDCACPEPKLDEGLETKEDCNTKKPGQTCKLSCKSRQKLIGMDFIKCDINTKWSSQPKCKLMLCPKPNFPGNILRTAENCSSKTIGEECKLTCTHGGKLLGQNTIICLNETRWSTKPDCSCPVPTLEEGLEVKENCSSKKRGETCKLHCKGKQKLTGMDFIICQRNTKWSPQPKCKLIFCPKLNLNGSVLRTAENCSSKTIRDTCEVTCTEGGKLLGPNKITCINETQWSKQPDCACPVPVLEEGIETKENCSDIKRGETCKLRCKGKQKLIGRDFIKCESNTKWSSQPKCKLMVCPKPNFPGGILRTAENCSSKIVGEICKLICAEGGKVLGPNNMTCINETHWSTKPDCSCPVPILEQGLEVKENCNSKQRGETCKLHCKGKQKLTGMDFIICQRNTKWSPQPKCKLMSCPKLNLTGSLLRTAENCSSKTIGDTCKVTCTEGGKLLGPNKITCINETQWSKQPDCACPVPVLEEGIETKENCSAIKRGETCKLRCKGKQKLIGRDFIKCESNTKWSSQPKCKLMVCPKPNFPGGILRTAENCSSKTVGEICKLICAEGGKVLGPNNMTCINETHWSTKPDCSCAVPTLEQGLEVKENCNSKKRGETCKLHCKGKQKLTGMDFIICQRNTKWSPQPKCKLMSCPKLNLTGSLLRTAENCSSKTIGDTCKVTCTEGGNLLGPNKITCINETQWSKQPDCACPVPVLEEGIETKENCSAIKRGETCKLRCKGKQKLIGRDFIKCESNTKWSSQPKCKLMVCPKPNFPGGILRPTENCSSKTVGEICKLICAEGGKVLGPNNMTCINETHWSTKPDCSCPVPTLEQGLEVKENCSSKKRGETCKLHCKGKQKLTGMDFIICQRNTKWSPQPNCKLMSCPKLNLTGSILRTAENCSSKTIGDTCKVTCTEGGKLLGPNKITCINETQWSKQPDCACPFPVLEEGIETKENCSAIKRGETCKLRCKGKQKLIGRDFIKCESNTKWSSQPKCKLMVCPKPNFPGGILRTAENCSSKTVGEICKLICAEGGKVLGPNNMTCINETHWSTKPGCSCPVPTLEEGLEVKENCSSKKRGETCKLRCKGKQKLTGMDFIICQRNTKWSPQPNCKLMSCPKLNLTGSILRTAENCSSKTIGDTCKVTCTEGGKLLGPNKITCINETQWSKQPDCACPVPVLEEGIETKENCSAIKRGETCKLRCKGKQKLIGRDFIKCESNTKWSSQPKCKLMVCPKPNFPGGILRTAENCSSKTVGEICKLICAEGGKVLGPNNMTCINETHWSTKPDCSCPVPTLEEGLEVKENCSSKKRGETCKLHCKGKQKLTGMDFIICQRNTKWSPQPKCKLIFCPKLNLTGSILRTEENCSSKTIGDTCKVTCIEGGKLLGSNKISCITETQWSKEPDCACPVPVLEEGIETKENCSAIKRGETCKLRCKGKQKLVGRDFIKCESNTKWSSQPKCKLMVCPKPNFSGGILRTAENCSSKTVGEICKLICTEGGKVLGPNNITCINGTHWSGKPDCACPVPKLEEELEMKEDCNSKKRGETCKLNCKEKHKLIGVDFIKCERDTKWSPQPKCELIICHKPKFSPGILRAAENCSSKKIGDICRLVCTEGGKILGPNNVTCLNETHWSTEPDCTCPAPELEQELELKENCNSKKRGETCKLHCKSKQRMIGVDFIKCEKNTKWSSQPKCKLIFCVEPKFPGGVLQAAENCSLKVLGDTCKLMCSAGGKLLGSNNMTCINETHWSAKPDCTCSAPKLEQGLETKEDCNSKKRGEICKLHCKGKQKLIGLDFIKCESDTKWSSQPKCKFVLCPEPKFRGGILRTTENCSSKTGGDTCKLECVEGGKILGLKSITCINGTHWSTKPDCTCPVPTLEHELETRENCSSKKRGETCKLRCKEKQKLIGVEFIKCERNTKWSSQPKCKFIICPKLSFPGDVLHTTENCSSKTVGDTCRLICNQGGKMLGPNFITCINETTWSKEPVCACPTPTLEHDLEVKENCSSKRRGEICKVRCKGKEKLLGADFIKCGNNTKWSRQPKCKLIFCPLPIFPDGILSTAENCSSKTAGDVCKLICKEGGKLLGTGSIICINGTHWSANPDCTCAVPLLEPGLVAKEECVGKKRGETCKLRCNTKQKLIGDDFITCENNTKWSFQPQCKLIVCPKPTFADDILRVIGNCSSKTLGETCTVVCSEGGQLSGENVIRCLNTTEWSSFPNCSCPAPVLVHPLKTNENCNSKRIGQTCKLFCPRHHQLVGSSSIRCQNNTKWTSLPKCKINTCPSPTLPENILHTAENCSSKRPREICKLKCTQGGEFIGRDHITCHKGLRWSSLPICACPTPLLRLGLETKENCNLREAGEWCMLKCEPGMKLIGNDSIMCLNDTKWSTAPKCQTIICSKPSFSGGILRIAENCSSKTVGDVCRLICNEGGKMVGRNFITCVNETAWSKAPHCACPVPTLEHGLEEKENCSSKSPGEICKLRCKGKKKLFGVDFIKCENNTKWSRQPTCKPIFCPLPIIPEDILTTSENCSSKTSGDACKLRCKEGGKVLGPENIVCINGTHWSANPDCTCGVPSLKHGLVSKEECVGKKKGETCNLRCIGKQEIVGDDFIICKNNTKWSSQPQCKLLVCPEPTFAEDILRVVGNCSSKMIGETCTVVCSEGGQLSGENIIKCLNTTQWSSFPNCSCPAPVLVYPLKTKENCNSKMIGQTCKLFCPRQHQLVGSSLIRCQNNTKWSSVPKCRIGICPPPVLPENILHTAENCSFKRPREECKLTCAQGGKFVGRDHMVCRKGLRWSSLPLCACPAPMLEMGLETKENCNYKEPGEWCMLKCKPGRKLIGNDSIMCLNDTRWSIPPECQIITCTLPELSNSVLKILGPCSGKVPGEKCSIECKVGLIVAPDGFKSSFQITCVNETHWSPLPECTCSRPKLSSIVIEAENCSLKQKGQHCKVRCPSGFEMLGNDFVVCLNNTYWSESPVCQNISVCPKPVLPEFLATERECSRVPVGRICNLWCRNGGTLIGASNKITCLKDMTWTEPPTCSCSSPEPTDFYNIVEDCTMKKVSEKCEIQCKDIYELPEYQFVCQANGKWNSPACRRIMCSEPVLHELLEFSEDCSSKYYGEYCLVKCRNDPTSRTVQYLLCSGWTYWSEQPSCAT